MQRVQADNARTPLWFALFALAAALAIACTSARSGEATVANSADPIDFTNIVLKIDGDVAFGEYLAGECVTCHRQSGDADGIPPIAGLTREYFVRALFEYKTNVRSNEVMKLRVASLSNEEIAALATYFASLKAEQEPVRKRQDP